MANFYKYPAKVIFLVRNTKIIRGNHAKKRPIFRLKVPTTHKLKYSNDYENKNCGLQTRLGAAEMQSDYGKTAAHAVRFA